MAEIASIRTVRLLTPPRYSYRTPRKVTPAVLEELRRMRAEGKSYEVCAGLLGIAKVTAWFWDTGIRKHATPSTTAEKK